MQCNMINYPESSMMDQHSYKVTLYFEFTLRSINVDNIAGGVNNKSILGH